MLIGLAQRAANQNRTPLVTPRDLQVGNCRRTLTSIELSPASSVATRAPQCQKHPCENSAHSRVARLTLWVRGAFFSVFLNPKVILCACGAVFAMPSESRGRSFVTPHFLHAYPDRS